MKNLPEKELFNDLESRLRQYTEEPDEKSWDQISAALHPVKPGGKGVWLERTADVLVIALLFFLFWNSVGEDTAVVNTSPLGENKNEGKAGSETTESIPMESSTSAKVNEQQSAFSDNKKSADESVLENNEGKDLEKETMPDVQRGKTGTKQPGRSGSIAGKSNSKNSNTTSTTGFIPDQAHSDRQVENNVSTGYSGSSGSENDGSSSAENVNTNAIAATEVSKEKKDSVEVRQVLPENKKTVVADSKKEAKEQKKRKHATMYFSLTPSLAYQKMTPVKNDEVVIKSLPSESIFSSNRLGISLEAGFQKRIFKQLDVYAGVSYYMQDQDISYNVQSKDNVTVETTDDLEYVVTPGLEKRKFEYSMRNVGVSTGIFYLIKDGRLQHKAGIGVQYQKGLGKTSTETGYENSSSQYLSYQLNYRMEFSFNKRTSFYVQPNFTRAFYSRETLGEPFTIKPYRAGFGFGLLYTF